MRILEPKIELWKQGDDVKAHVAKCARVYYGKESGNDNVTINTLLKNIIGVCLDMKVFML